MEGRSVHEGHLCSVRPPMKCHYSTYSVETMIGVVVVVCGGDARLPLVVLVKVCTSGALVRSPMKYHYSTYSVETMIVVVVVVCGGDARLPHVVLVKVCTRGSLVLRAAANEIPLLYLLGGDDDCGGDAVVLE